MRDSGSVTQEAASVHAVAQRLVETRLRAQAQPGFPALLFPDLETAYRCQDEGIKLWPNPIIGWKIGGIAPDFRPVFQQDRLTGPIFKEALRIARDNVETPFPVFVGGFAAVEGEFVLRIGKDAPVTKTSWSVEEAAAMVDAMHIGIETAGSPMAAINDLGPSVIASDFGNNNGLILGAAIPDWRGKAMTDLRCETFMRGASVGKGHAGPLMEALCFLLSLNARRGHPLKAGDYISTGAVTGIHDIVAGESARVDFGPFGQILCKAVAAEPSSAGAR